MKLQGAAGFLDLKDATQDALDRYAGWCRRHGLCAEGRMAVGTEVTGTLEELCLSTARDFPQAVFFTGKLVFEKEKPCHRLLHNETAYAVQNRLQFQGLQTVILPIRVL